MFLVAGAFIPVGGILMTWGFSRLKRKWTLEHLPPSRPGSAAMGFAEVRGRVKPVAWLKAPLTSFPCAWYRFLVEGAVKKKGGGGGWGRISGGESTDLFALEDGSGLILVDPVGAEVVLRPSYRFSGDEGAFGQPRRYTEWTLREGDEVFILGTVRKLADEQVIRRETIRQRLRELKTDKERLDRFDLNRDGRIDQAEWDHARGWVEEELLKEEAALGKSSDQDNVVGKGDDGVLTISDRSPRDTTRALEMEAGLGVVCGALLVLGGVAALLAGLGML